MKEDEYKKSCIEMNNEELLYKMSIPMFEEGELETFDNYIHSIAEEYSKMIVKEKDQILTQRIIMKQNEEIERLHSIIKKAREYIENNNIYSNKKIDDILEILDKEKE